MKLVNPGATAGCQPQLCLGRSQTAVTPQACQGWVESHHAVETSISALQKQSRGGELALHEAHADPLSHLSLE